MRFTFLGGSDKIGSTAMLLESNVSKFIFEYGITPSAPPGYPLEAPPVDYILLTHAHLDHSGLIPLLTRQYHAQFFTSQMTYMLSQILLRDNIKICELEGYPLMYSKADIRNMDENLHQTEMDSKFNLKNHKLLVHSAGHIPGATMFELRLENGLKLLFTGDINTIDTRLVNGITGKKCDILVMEATYAGRNHKLRQKIEYEFIEKIKDVIARAGKVIIPAFAVGRTQEILLVLADLDFDIWLDGLGIEVTKLFLKEPRFIKDEKKLRKIYENVNKVRTKARRKKALAGDIILTTSGMLDGGPVLRYIKEFNDNSKNALLLTGYQVEGSNGRLLLDKKVINMNGVIEKINLDVEYYDFSAHAGHNELIRFAHKCNPEHIILYHGENRELLEKELSKKFEVHLPTNNMGVEF